MDPKKQKLIGAALMLPAAVLIIYLLLSAKFWIIAILAVITGIMALIGYGMFRGDSIGDAAKDAKSSSENVFVAEGWIGVEPEPEVSEVRRFMKFVSFGVPAASATLEPSNKLTAKLVTRTDSDELWFCKVNEPTLTPVVFGLTF